MDTSTMIPTVSGARPVVGHSAELLRDPLALLRRGRSEHGRVFRLRLPMKDAVVLLGTEHNRLAFGETDHKLSIRTAYPFFYRMFSPEFYFFAPYDEYKRQRQVILPRFQGRQLDTYVEIMESEARVFMDGLGDAGEFSVPEDFGPLIMRVAAHAFLGERFAETTTDWFGEFRRFSEGTDFIMPGWLPLPHLLRSRAAGRRIRERLQRIIDRRRAAPGEGGDFLDHFVEAEYEDGTPVPDDILIHMIVMLVWAGHETTTGQISWGLIDLLRHPVELERAREEIADAPDAMTAGDVRRLEHLDRCLHESERLHPVVPIMVRSAVEPMEVDGLEIPEGAVVLLSPAATHRLDEEFPDPDAYLPERYDDDPQQLRGLVGFGGGLHRCLGMRFAYLEMTVVLARLLQHYDLKLLDDPKPITGNGPKWPQPARVAYRRR